MLGKLGKQERGGRLLRTSPTVGVALLILTFSAGSAAQDVASGSVVPAGIYANHEQVAAALAKGGPLIDNPNTPAAIKVSGSHRDKAGVVEVHEKETDIFYVSDGEATLIAGGTRVKVKNAAANHQYDVEGGKTFHLTKGDIMVIPAGSPHWFKEVPKSISYHVVKLTTPAGGTGTDVTYVEHDKVAAALNSKGEIFSAPKLRLSGGYRTGPDQPANYGADPEVHPTSIDIFYCIDGAVTVVTGGKVVGMKESGDHRMAGAKVEQGRADHMTKGDWLLVPSGTPHWHTEYPKPFGFYRYLLVKVQE
jgi:quercetin dioxygenase-like cupin family protein